MAMAYRGGMVRLHHWRRVRLCFRRESPPVTAPPNTATPEEIAALFKYELDDQLELAERIRSYGDRRASEMRDEIAHFMEGVRWNLPKRQIITAIRERPLSPDPKRGETK